MYTENIDRSIKEECTIEYTQDYKKFFENFTNNVVLFIDENVKRLYGSPIEDPLICFVTPLSDEAKTLDYYAHVVNEMGKHKIDSHVTVVSFGGGSVSNLAGFVAGTYKRGVKFVSVPTTLLAMVDACISYKQAINTCHGKNQVGLYKVPSKIIIDRCFLKTLDQRFISDGYAEIIKHAVCESPQLLRALSEDDSEDVVLPTIKLKINHIKNDPWELHPILMYGHQIGHAIEYLSGERYYHGEAINVGMIGTSFIGEQYLKEHKILSDKYNLPKTFSTEGEFTLSQVIDFMYNDKSVKNGKVYYYIRGEEVPVTDDQIRKSLNYVCRDRYIFKNGYEMPKNIFGTCGIKEGSVYEAIKVGYRAFDCAYYYQNEQMIGQEIKRALDEGLCTREDLFVIGKLWNNQHDMVEEACKKSLSLLGLDYFDLYMIHWPVRYTGFEDEFGTKTDIKKVYRDMKKLECTLCRNVGVSNFNIEDLEGIDPVVNQVEFHPYYRNEKLKEYCDSNGILTMAYSPLSPQFCKDYSAKESIQWILQEGAAVVTKSDNPSHMKENLFVDGEVKEDTFENKILKTIKWRT